MVLRAEPHFSGGVHLARFCQDEAATLRAVPFWILGSAGRRCADYWRGWKRRKWWRKAAESKPESRRRQSPGQSLAGALVWLLAWGESSPQRTGVGADSTLYRLDSFRCSIVTCLVVLMDLQ